jgi:hypothetical protein
MGLIITLICFLIWALKPWHNAYYVGESLVDIVKYQDRNVFKIPLIKIYRTKKYSKDEMDIFAFLKVDRFRKVMKYKLIEANNEDVEIILQHKENQDAVNQKQV